MPHWHQHSTEDANHHIDHDAPMRQIDKEQTKSVIVDMIHERIDDNGYGEYGHKYAIGQVHMTFGSCLPLWSNHWFDRIMIQSAIACFEFTFVRGDNFVRHGGGGAFLCVLTSSSSSSSSVVSLLSHNRSQSNESSNHSIKRMRQIESSLPNRICVSMRSIAAKLLKRNRKTK